MRLLLVAALAALALPTLAQTDREVHRVIIVNGDTVDTAHNRFDVEIDEDVEVDGGHIVIRRGDGDPRVVEFEMPNRFEVETLLDRTLEGPMAFFRTEDGGTFVERHLGRINASSETRARMRELEADARRHARRARTADTSERRDAEAALNRTLDELFDVRAQARRERAESLRQRAEELSREAAAIEAGLADRETRRRALIEARRAELLGEDPTSDW